VISLTQSVACHARVTVVFRYDDYAARYPGEGAEQYARRVATDEALIDTFRRHRIAVTVAVQPYASDYVNKGVETEYNALDDDRRRILILGEGLDDGTIEVALHGYAHHALVTDPRPSEFAGLSMPVQQYRIATGRRLLRQWLGRPIEIFVPPYNTYDETTLHVLANEDFRVISGSCRFGPQANPRLLYIPQNSGNRLRRGLSLVRRANRCEDHAFVVYMLHPFDFTLWEFQDPHTGERTVLQPKHDISDVDNLLQELAQQEMVEVLSIGQVASRYAQKLMAAGQESFPDLAGRKTIARRCTSFLRQTIRRCVSSRRRNTY